ncbi:MAG: Hsp70 family protein [Myxococcales bacterium]|nr:Hsp70 family protein [Myxococcales bacterium]
MERYIGIDFGTTNSAIAIADDGASPHLVPFPVPTGGEATTWRTVLYFEPGDGPRPEVSAGALAIGRYLESGGDGRFIQSVKSHLASRLFSKTSILSRNYSLEELIASYVQEIRKASPINLGSRAVVGRPVRYWGATGQEDNDRAISRMRRGLELAGFDYVVFENEPNAAAAKYGASLQHEELVLTADFGGGTSDFCLLRITPGQGENEILATGGLGVGGDTFDGCMIDSVVAPQLGKGTTYGDGFGAQTEVPRSLYANLRRWHHLAFLKSRKTMALLQRIAGAAEFPDRIHSYIHVVENDLGLPLHQAIERAKVSLSNSEEGDLDFRDPPISIVAPITRTVFGAWIASDLDKIDAVVEQLLADGGVSPDQVHRVFTTGGSSFVPAVRGRLERRFPGRLRGGEEMTSVALGLAERARELFT